jgi:ATP-binding cassette subfamily F protein 3
LHVALTDPQVLRDGERIKQIMAELETQKASLPTLYEHWEEAIELNG